MSPFDGHISILPETGLAVGGPKKRNGAQSETTCFLIVNVLEETHSFIRLEQIPYHRKLYAYLRHSLFQEQVSPFDGHISILPETGLAVGGPKKRNGAQSETTCFLIVNVLEETHSFI